MPMMWLSLKRFCSRHKAHWDSCWQTEPDMMDKDYGDIIGARNYRSLDGTPAKLT